MTKFFVPEMLLDELICIKCKGYLSVFPIHISGEGLGGICGRCDNSDDGFIHDQGYECMVKDLSFPCVFKKNGCPANLTPAELKKHESECEFDKCSCFIEDCEWRDAFDKLLQHFVNDHGDMVLAESNFNFNYNIKFDKVMILEHKSELYEVTVKFDENKKILSHSVKAVRTSNKSHINTYNLKLSSKQDTFTTKACLMSEGEKKLQEEDLSQAFDDPKDITANIAIKLPFKNEGAVKGSAEIIHNPNIDWKILTDMECPICFDHMFPPIYQCMIGHSICENCKPKLTECPSCKGKLENTRNFVLENMTQKLNYPCKYYKQGCSFYENSGVIRNHQLDCQYGPLQCPMKKCEWSSNEGDFWPHAEHEHAENIPKNNKISCDFEISKKIDETYFIKFGEKVFIILFKYVASNFYWTVQLMGVKQDAEKFLFEIDIVDLSGNQMRCCWGGLVRTKNGNEALEAYISLPYEQIKTFIKDFITFKVKVFKD